MLNVMIWCLVLSLGGVTVTTHAGAFDSKTLTSDPRLAGGDTTIFDVTSAAFEAPAPNLTEAELLVHIQGDAAFDAAFVSAPAPIFSGLGPIFNNTACSACHPGNGRGEPAEPDNLRPPTMFLRLSLPGADALTGAPLPVPGFGFQLQHRALFGVEPEASLQVTYTENTELFDDGTEIRLRRPSFMVVEPYQPLPEGVLTSPRVALPVFARGLLEAIDEATLLGFADEMDMDGDAISGRPNIVWDFLAQVPVLGRFGWKANNPNLVQQSAGAYAQDMGVTNPYFPRESSAEQSQFDGREDEPEIDQETLDVTRLVVTSMIRSCNAAKRCLQPPSVLPAIFRWCKPECCRVYRGLRIKRFIPTPTCCYTIWGRGSPMAVRTFWPVVASGVRHRFGALA
ncbi:hypothetical protein C2W62_25880 [Candidatus Entotheonella serta]|nr:hypothetical protein C2W62_25880 [Candidatus Entotheonella serta]